MHTHKGRNRLYVMGWGGREGKGQRSKGEGEERGRLKVKFGHAVTKAGRPRSGQVLTTHVHLPSSVPW